MIVECEECCGTGVKSYVVVESEDSWTEYNGDCDVCDGEGQIETSGRGVSSTRPL
jgi:hypothetical protein